MFFLLAHTYENPHSVTIIEVHSFIQNLDLVPVLRSTGKDDLRTALSTVAHMLKEDRVCLSVD